MDRIIVYPGALPLDTDMLNVQRNAMISDGLLAQAMLGTGTAVVGLACAPTSPASMAVNIGPGMISSMQTVDATAFGSLPADTADSLVKVGINLTTTLSSSLGTITAPATSGQSQVYLISVGFTEADSGSTVLSYYDAANPSVAYSGPANSGAPQNTQRTQRAALTLTAGTPATTGTQVAPATPGSNVALWQITVAYGAATITSGNIVAAPGAPFVGGGSVQPGRLLNVQKWTAAGTYTYTPTVGTNSTVWEVRGAGGSGGGAAATTASTNSAAASGGGSGAFVRHRATSGFGGAAIVVGAGGAAPIAGANNGSNGAASSVTATGFTLNAPGGGYGNGAAAGTTSAITGPGAPGAVGTGGNLLNVTGDQGGLGLTVVAGSSFWGASGDGGEADGGGGATVGTTNAGVAGTAPGAGGSGAASGCTGAGGSATAGGAGADGGVWVWEFS